MRLTQKTKTIISFISRFGFSALLLAYLFSKIDMENTVSVVKSADPSYLMLAGFFFVLINIFILIRWWVFVRALELDATFRKVMRFFFIGLFGNLFLPSSVGGDFIKIVGLCKNSSQKPKVVASVVMDRLSGFGGIVVVAIFAVLFGYQMIEDKTIIVSILALTALSGVVGFVLFNERIYEFCCRLFSKFPKIKQNLMRVHYDIALLKGNRASLFQAIGISALAQTTFAFVFFLIAKALNQDISLIYFFIFVPLICVASLVPSIGGLGVREAGAAFLFAKIGVESGVSVSISLINFVFMVIVGLIGGIIYVVTISPRRVQHRQQDTGINPKEA